MNDHARKAPVYTRASALLNLCPTVPMAVPARGFHWEGGVCRRCLRWRGDYRPPSPWTLLHVGVVRLCTVAIVPILRWGHWGLDNHRRGSHHHWGVRILRPGRPPTPIRPPECPEPDPNADPWASKPVVEAMVKAVASVPMASKAVAFEPMPTPEAVAPKSMPATVSVPWHGAYPEQHRQYDDDPDPLLSCSHGHHLSALPHFWWEPSGCAVSHKFYGSQSVL